MQRLTSDLGIKSYFLLIPKFKLVFFHPNIYKLIGCCFDNISLTFSVPHLSTCLLRTAIQSVSLPLILNSAEYHLLQTFLFVFYGSELQSLQI